MRTKKDVWTLVITIAATILLLLPILFMVGLSIARLIESGRFMMDYLIPGELAPFILLGVGLLIWAAFRAKMYKKPVLWGVVALIVGFGGSQLFAVLSGMASGKAEPTNTLMGIFGGIWAIYIFSIIYLGILGIRLILAKARKETSTISAT